MPDPATDNNDKLGIWERRSTRRGLLGIGAAGVAGGASTVILGLARDGVDGDGSAGGGESGPGDSTTEPPDEEPTVVPPAGQIEEPERRAAHLLRRAGFGGTRKEVAEFAELGREEAADRLLDFDSFDASLLEDHLLARDYNTYRLGDAYRRWLTRMVYSPRQLEERMTFIWHGFLTSQLSQIGGPFSRRIKLMDAQIDLYRTMALPVYDELLKAVSKDPAMMIFLNSVDSSAGQPNENYPRELMELFSMGEGNYSEEDVREAARAFTGWRFTGPGRRPSNPDDRDEQEELMRGWQPEFFVASRLHDEDEKTFLGATGNWDGIDIIDLIMADDAPVRFITTRLFHEFVHDHPSASALDELSGLWHDSGHDVRAVVRAILVSDEFYSEEAYRAKVRSPIELLVGAVRGLELEWDFRGAERFSESMGQLLYNPPNVAGWPGGPAWISSGTFLARVNFIDLLFFQSKFGIKPGILSDNSSAQEAVDLAVVALLDGNISDSSRELMVEHVSSARNAIERGRAAAYLALSSPEFQTT